MSPDGLKNLMHAEPFKAFTLHTSDGRAVRVPHPDFISISPAGRTAIIHTNDEEFEVLDVFLIAGAKVGKAAKV